MHSYLSNHGKIKQNFSALGSWAWKVGRTVYTKSQKFLTYGNGGAIIGLLIGIIHGYFIGWIFDAFIGAILGVFTGWIFGDFLEQYLVHLLEQ